MKKSVFVIIVCCVLLGAGCASEKVFNTSTSYFNNFMARGGLGEGDLYTVSGTVHQSVTDAHLLYIQPKQEMEITVEGYMDREEGDIRLVYVREDGTEIPVAQNGGKKRTDISSNVKLSEGMGYFAFTGDGAVYEFELTFSGLDENLLEYMGQTYSGDGGSGMVTESLGSGADEHLEDIPGIADSLDSDDGNGESAEDGADEDSLVQLGSTKLTLSRVDEALTVLKVFREEEGEVFLNADIVVKQKQTPLTLGEFRLFYRTQDAEETVMIEHEGKDRGLGGFEWQGHYSESVTLPAGETEIVLEQIKGRNYQMEISVRAEAEK